MGCRVVVVKAEPPRCRVPSGVCASRSAVVLLSPAFAVADAALVVRIIGAVRVASAAGCGGGDGREEEFPEGGEGGRGEPLLIGAAEDFKAGGGGHDGGGEVIGVDVAVKGVLGGSTSDELMDAGVPLLAEVVGGVRGGVGVEPESSSNGRVVV